MIAMITSKEKIEKIIKESEILPINFIQDNGINAEYLGSTSFIDNQRFTTNVGIYWLVDYNIKKWQYM